MVYNLTKKSLKNQDWYKSRKILGAGICLRHLNSKERRGLVPREENVPQRAQHDGFWPCDVLTSEIVPAGKPRRHPDSKNPRTLLPKQLPANPDATAVCRRRWWELRAPPP